MQTTLSEKASAYLEGRGYDPETVVKLQISSVSRKRGNPPEPHECVVIPYVQRGKIVAHKLRDIDATQRREQWFWEKQPTAKLILWNRDVISDQTLGDLPLIITEGEWDAIAAIEAGFPRTVSVPAGANEKPADGDPERAKSAHAYIDEAFDDIKRCGTIILATDNDSAGQNLRDDLVARFGRARCKIAEYPEDCKDLNDVLKKYGCQGVRDAIDRARYIPTDVVSLFDIPNPGPLEVYKLRGLGPDFEERIGFCRGQVSWWTGYANKGKTTLFLNMLHGAIKEWGWRVGGALFEDDVWRTFEPAMSRIYHGRNGLTANDMRESREWINEWFKFIQPPEGGEKTLSWFLENADVCVKRHGCRLIFLDPWTEISLTFDKRRGPDTMQIGWYIDQCTEFAKRNNCHVAIAAHPSKPGPDRNAIPDLYSISGSAHFANKAFLGVSVHSYDDLPGVTDVLVSKVKIKPEMGMTGKFSLRFDPGSRRFSGMSKAERKFMEDQATAGFQPKGRKRRDVFDAEDAA